MSVSKKLIAAAAAALMFSCSGGPSGPARSAGSIATSNDQKFLYVADTDNGTLSVLDSAKLTQVSSIPVGKSPFRVVVGADDTVYVANRGSRSISVVHKGEWSVANQIATGVDPVGMQLSDDGKTLYVVSATAKDTTDYGTLAAVDTTTLQPKWELPVGAEPRGIALVQGNRAIITQYKAGDFTTVDLNAAQVVGSSTDIYTQVNQSSITAAGAEGPASGPAYVPIAFHPRALADVVATPAGDRVFGLGVLSRESPILTPPSTEVPYYESQGPSVAGSVTTSAIFTVDIGQTTLTPRIEDATASPYGYTYDSSGNVVQAQSQNEYPQTSLAVSGTGTTPVVQGPTVGVVDATGDWLYMLNRESRNLSVVSTHARVANPQAPNATDPSSFGFASTATNELPSVYSTVTVGPGADGVAVMGDNATAYVYSQFDHTVTKIQLDARAQQLVVMASSQVTTDVLPPDVVAGRLAFHDANDRTISAASASIACSSCHLEGRDDTHVWQFPDGPRQTPTLAGRGTLDTAPYHWSGQFATIEDFLNHTVTTRMGGTGLSADQIRQLNAYVGSLEAPENPYIGSAPTAQQQHGEQLFTQSGCSSCHTGQWFSNTAEKDVGTLVTDPADPDDLNEVGNGFNVPSLRGLARSAPYLHDGSAPTLLDRLNRNTNDMHGVTSTLSDQDKRDLVAYLQTL